MKPPANRTRPVSLWTGLDTLPDHDSGRRRRPNSCRWLLYTVHVQSTKMVLRIDLSSQIPVYRQIVDGLRILLVNGELKPGDSLPAVRRLALDLGVHFNTVAEAYRTLAAEGWLETARRSGTQVVARPAQELPDPAAAEGFQRRLQELVADWQSRGLSSARVARELRRMAESLERS